MDSVQFGAVTRTMGKWIKGRMHTKRENGEEDEEEITEGDKEEKKKEER